jgi:hypothetical protein
VTFVCVGQVTTVMVIPFMMRRRFLKWLVRFGRHHKVSPIAENSSLVSACACSGI